MGLTDHSCLSRQPTQKTKVLPVQKTKVCNDLQNSSLVFLKLFEN